MYRVAILGSENSHAWWFASILTGKQTNGVKMFPELELVGVYGDDESNQKLKEFCGFDEFADHYNDFLGKVDGIMVTARHGDNHYKYAKDYIKLGIPVWLDKPFTANPSEALEMAKLAIDCDTRLCGGSMLGIVDDTLKMQNLLKENAGTLCGGAVSAPIHMKNDYGDFWFYSQHLVQIMLTVFGYDVKSVYALSREDRVTAIYRYENFDVTAQYGTDYSVTIYGGDKVIFQNISLEGGFEREVKEFAQMLATGKQERSYDELVKPVFVLDATIKAFQSGKETAVEGYTI